MKKLFALLIAIISCVAVFAFAGCTTDEREQTTDKIEQGYSICYAFTASNDIITITDSTSMKDYMDALKKAGRLSFEGSDGDYGYYITSVLGVSSVTVSSTANSYSGYDWTVYTTSTTIDGTIYSSDSETFTYNGITLYKAAYGVSGIPCVSGQTYALVYELSSMSW